MKKSYFACLLLLLFLWFVGVALHLPSTQKDLAQQARELLDRPRHDGVFAKVQVAFSGQEATLTGAVATDEEKRQLESIVSRELRLKDQQPQRNPVTAVHNLVEVNPDAAPQRSHPWLIVAVYGTHKRVEGILKQAEQRQALLAALEEQWPAADAIAKERSNQVIVETRALPVPDWSQTLKNFPNFVAALADKQGKDRAFIAVTVVDGKWQLFPPTATDAEIAQALSAARVTAQQVALALNDLRIRPELNIAPQPPK